MITTKFGDKGNTTIKGKIIEKDSQLIQTIGSIDEAQAWIITLNSINNKSLYLTIIKDLYLIMGYISGYNTELDNISENIIKMENYIYSTQPLAEFVYPQELETSYLNLARTVVRRAERELLKLIKTEQNYLENDNMFLAYQYLNRLSDYLFALSISYEKTNLSEKVIIKKI